MKAILFGSTGMVGQGVLRECLLDRDVESVLAVVRSHSGRQHEKLRELVHTDFLDFSKIERELSGYDACFYCLGVSSTGMSETDYQRVTYEITMAAAQTLARLNPEMKFVFVSGAGSDSTERSRSMWARVKGKTENALLRLPFKAVYIFRPAYIHPLHRIVSKTKVYRVFYAAMKPLYPLLKAIFPKYVTTTGQVGIAMLRVVRGAPERVLENDDINKIAGES